MPVREHTTTEAAAGDLETWSPFDIPARRTFDVSLGKWQATVEFSAWTAEERIAYEDATSTRLMTKNDDGDRTIRIGRMNALHIATTIRSWDGFPATLTRPPTPAERERAAERGQPGLDLITEATDLRRVEHIGALHPDVYEQLLECAREVQDLPGSEGKRNTVDDAAAAARGVADDDEEGEADVDPSRTPPTPPAAKAPARARSRAQK